MKNCWLVKQEPSDYSWSDFTRDRGTSWTDRGLRSGWHTFAVDWQPGRLIWLIRLVDGLMAEMWTYQQNLPSR